MTDRRLYVRAAEVPRRSQEYNLTAGRPYPFRSSNTALTCGHIQDDEGCPIFIRTERHEEQCESLYGTTARWEIVDADGNSVTPETEERE